MSNENKPKPAPLTRETFTQMGNALARLHEIKNTEAGGVIQTPGRKSEAQKLEQEALGLIDYLSTEFIAHGQEFLGAWHVTKNEYEPLVNGFLNFFSRCATANHDRVQQFNAQAKAAKAKQVADAEAPKNIVALPTTPKTK